MKRKYLLAIWLTAAAIGLSLYVFKRDAVLTELRSIFGVSLLVASLVYLALGGIRAFTLVPATYLIFAAIPFFPPALLFGLTMAGVLTSSSIIYMLSRSLKLDEWAAKSRHAAHVARLRAALDKHELPVIIGWSFMLVAPTDILCCVCGALRINLPKFLVGIFIGEGTIYAIYIFAGDSLLRWLGWK